MTHTPCQTTTLAWVSRSLPLALAAACTLFIHSPAWGASGSSTISLRAGVAAATAKAATSQTRTAPYLQITTVALPNATTGVAYLYQMTANLTGIQLTWTATGLPPGLTLSSAGLLSGTPSVYGTFAIQFTVDEGHCYSDTDTINLVINPPMSITTAEFPATTVGRPYLQTLQASGGTGALTWTGSGLPPGLQLSTAGIVSGITSQAGYWTIHATVTDTLPTSTSRYLSVIVNPLPSILTASLPNPVAGTAYQQTLQGTGGTGTLTWSATGLPAGLSISPSGTISGTPTASGQFTPTITVTDSLGAAASRPYGVDSATGFTIQTIPAGQRFLADGQQYTAPQTFNWSVGSNHTVSALVPNPPNADTRYAFSNWSDNGDFTHTVTVNGPATLTVTYALQYRILSATTPPFAGSVALVPPSPDGFYTHGASVGAQATVNTGFRFLQWGGPMTGNIHIGSMVVTGPGTIFANFQQTPSCEYSLSRTELPVLPSGYSGRVEVLTAPGCAWSATTAADWITIRSAHGTGIGNVLFDVTPNLTSQIRSAAISVAGQTLTIAQDSAGCSILFSPNSSATPVEGGTFPISVSAPADCLWVPAANPAFVQITPGPRTGPNTVNVSVTRNPELLPRTGSVIIGGITHPILQQAAQMTGLYRDVPASHPFHDAIYLATLNHLTSGCEPGLYCPDQPLNRAEMAEFIVKALLGKEVYSSNTPYFSDVPASHPQFRYIQKLKELGITTGCSQSAYCPSATTTRTEMSVFLSRAKLGLVAGQAIYHFPLPFFDDVPSTNPFFPFVQKMRELGITTGCSATSFCPNANVTKGKMAMFVVRSLLTR